MAPVGFSFVTMVVIIAFAVILYQYLSNQWIRYRNPFHDIIIFFKSCFSRGEGVISEVSISQQNTQVPPSMVIDGILCHATDKEFRKFFIMRYAIQKVGYRFDVQFRIQVANGKT